MAAFKHILAATDFSDASGRALDAGLDIGSRFGSKITVVHAISRPPPFYLPYGDKLAWPNKELASEARRMLDPVVARAKSRDAALVVVGLVANGEPWESILAVAKVAGADLIVMATHSRRGLSHLFLGSVAEKIVRMSPVPVLTVGAENAA